MLLAYIVPLTILAKCMVMVSCTCSPPARVDNSSNNSSAATSYPDGTAILYECNSGYHLSSGNSIKICVNTEWSGNVVCTITTCPGVYDPYKGYIVGTASNIAGSTVDFACNEGYRLKGASSLLCRSNGYWEPQSPPTCEVVVCPEFDGVSNGNIHQDMAGMIRNSYSSTISLSCNRGFIQTGSSTMVCGANGQWKGEFECIESLCPDYPTNSSCIEDYQSSKYVHEMYCKEGANISVTQVGSGLDDCIGGQWSHGTSACYCDCYVDQTKPHFVARNLDNSFLKHGKTLEWSCTSGARKLTDASIQCSDGKMETPGCTAPPVTTTLTPVNTSDTHATDGTGKPGDKPGDKTGDKTESTVTPDPVDIKTPVSSPNETEESEGLTTTTTTLTEVHTLDSLGTNKTEKLGGELDSYRFICEEVIIAISALVGIAVIGLLLCKVLYLKLTNTSKPEAEETNIHFLKENKNNPAVSENETDV